MGGAYVRLGVLETRPSVLVLMKIQYRFALLQDVIMNEISKTLKTGHVFSSFSVHQRHVQAGSSGKSMNLLRYRRLLLKFLQQVASIRHDPIILRIASLFYQILEWTVLYLTCYTLLLIETASASYNSLRALFTSGSPFPLSKHLNFEMARWKILQTLFQYMHCIS